MGKSKIIVIITFFLILILGIAAIFVGYTLTRREKETEELPTTGEEKEPTDMGPSFASGTWTCEMKPGHPEYAGQEIFTMTTVDKPGSECTQLFDLFTGICNETASGVNNVAIYTSTTTFINEFDHASDPTITFNVNKYGSWCDEPLGQETPSCQNYCGENPEIIPETFTIDNGESYPIDITVESKEVDANGNPLACGSFQTDIEVVSFKIGENTYYLRDCVGVDPDLELSIYGWGFCTTNNECPEQPTEGCGNGQCDTGEKCDPTATDIYCGDNPANMGTCRAAGSRDECTYCGDGITQGNSGEACDDGNDIDDDGCTSTCTINAGQACGDGTVDPGEECDDGNTTDCDGCSTLCKLENCQSVTRSPSDSNVAANSNVSFTMHNPCPINVSDVKWEVEGTPALVELSKSPTSGTSNDHVINYKVPASATEGSQYCVSAQWDNKSKVSACRNCFTVGGAEEPAYYAVKTGQTECINNNTAARITYKITVRNVSNVNGHIDYVEDTYDYRYQSSWVSSINPTPDSHAGNIIRWDNNDTGYNINANSQLEFSYIVTIPVANWGSYSGGVFVPNTFENTAKVKPQDGDVITVKTRKDIMCVTPPSTGTQERAVISSLLGLLLLIIGAILVRYKSYTYKYIMPLETGFKNTVYYISPSARSLKRGFANLMRFVSDLKGRLGMQLKPREKRFEDKVLRKAEKKREK